MKDFVKDCQLNFVRSGINGFNCCTRSWKRQHGHVFEYISHESRQSLWKIWLQFVVTISLELRRFSKHIGHSASIIGTTRRVFWVSLFVFIIWRKEKNYIWQPSSCFSVSITLYNSYNSYILKISPGYSCHFLLEKCNVSIYIKSDTIINIKIQR